MWGGAERWVEWNGVTQVGGEWRSRCDAMEFGGVGWCGVDSEWVLGVWCGVGVVWVVCGCGVGGVWGGGGGGVGVGGGGGGWGGGGGGGGGRAGGRRFVCL